MTSWDLANPLRLTSNIVSDAFNGWLTDIGTGSARDVGGDASGASNHNVEVCSETFQRNQSEDLIGRG